MKRSIQEIIELLVFGLIAVLIGTGLLWVVGWVIGGLGALFKIIAGLIWSLLRFVVPIAVVGAAVYALVRLLQGQRGAPSNVDRVDRPAGSDTGHESARTGTVTGAGTTGAGTTATDATTRETTDPSGTITQAPQPAPPGSDTTVKDTMAPDAPSTGATSTAPAGSSVDEPPARTGDVPSAADDVLRRETGAGETAGDAATAERDETPSEREGADSGAGDEEERR